MKYWGYMPNDFINGEGVSVSLWTSGCPHKCEGCFNPETWDKESGYDVSEDLDERLLNAISANGIVRNFSILGGEPLVEYNASFVLDRIINIRKKFPNIKIYLWTGYTLENLKSQNSAVVSSILDKIDVLIDGQFDKNLKDLTLNLRGSSNQRVLRKGIDF